MYSLLTKLEPADLLKRQLPSLFSAMVIAEFFYKFHSFTLECIAFLATWFVIDGVISRVMPKGKAAPGARRA